MRVKYIETLDDLLLVMQQIVGISNASTGLELHTLINDKKFLLFSMILLCSMFLGMKI
jgi:hypothetical protein